MHTYLTSADVQTIDNGVRITLSSPAGDYTFDANEVLVQSLIDNLINKMYFDKIPRSEQLSLMLGFENE